MASLVSAGTVWHRTRKVAALTRAVSTRQGFWYSNAAVAAGPAAVRLPHWAGVLDFSVTIEDLAPAAPEPAPEPAAQEESGGGWGCAALPRELSAPRTAAVGCRHLWAWSCGEMRLVLRWLTRRPRLFAAAGAARGQWRARSQAASRPTSSATNPRRTTTRWRRSGRWRRTGCSRTRQRAVATRRPTRRGPTASELSADQPPRRFPASPRLAMRQAPPHQILSGRREHLDHEQASKHHTTRPAA